MLVRMSRRKVSTTIYITEEQNELLKRLNDQTKVPVAEYIRQGIDLILERHRLTISPQRQLDFSDVHDTFHSVAAAATAVAVTAAGAAATAAPAPGLPGSGNGGGPVAVTGNGVTHNEAVKRS
jgi:hypothetical protein